jgi:hypothetical protein
MSKFDQAKDLSKTAKFYFDFEEISYYWLQSKKLNLRKQINY